MANTGTPIIIPTSPINSPATSIANNIQKADIPIESPNILGPIIFPSICCIININIKNIKAFVGDTNNIIINDGIAPINGPKNGIILVTPIITDINKVYGILNIENTTNDNTPIIAESIILPLKNFPNISFVLCVNSKILLAILSENNAHVIFLFIAKKYSLSINR